MSDWKAAEEQSYRDFLYIEELTTEEGASVRLTGIKTSQTVEDLQKCIARELSNSAAWKALFVTYEGKGLFESTRTLSSYGIQDGSTLFFTRIVNPEPIDSPPPYSGDKIINNLLVRNLAGITLPLHGVPLSLTVRQLKERLGREKAMDMDELRMIWSGKQLEDDKTLQFYGLDEVLASMSSNEKVLTLDTIKNSTIHLVARLRGGFFLKFL